MENVQKLKLSDFAKNDRFELNSYLTYLFQQFHYHGPSKLKEQIVK